MLRAINDSATELTPCPLDGKQIDVLIESEFFEPAFLSCKDRFAEQGAEAQLPRCSGPIAADLKDCVWPEEVFGWLKRCAGSVGPLPRPGSRPTRRLPGRQRVQPGADGPLAWPTDRCCLASRWGERDQLH